MLSTVQSLLKENEFVLMRERRSVQRRSFARPVLMKLNAMEFQCFSRDISPVGISIICPEEVRIPALAELHVLRLRQGKVVLHAEVRWCEGFGDGWFLTGWHFLESGS